MTLLRVIPLVLSLVLSGYIVWAMGEASLSTSFAAISADPWGVVTLIDLYVGFAVVIMIVWRLEPKVPIAVAVTVLTPLLGSLIPGFWLAFRLPGIRMIADGDTGSRRPPA